MDKKIVDYSCAAHSVTMSHFRGTAHLCFSELTNLNSQRCEYTLDNYYGFVARMIARGELNENQARRWLNMCNAVPSDYLNFIMHWTPNPDGMVDTVLKHFVHID